MDTEKDCSLGDAEKRLESPVTYQGGKSRIAAAVVDCWWGADGPFHDLCCGSGAISIEMVNRGFAPRDIVMVDAGPWGEVWRQIGDGTFNIDSFRYYTTLIPSDLHRVRDFMRELSQQSAAIDTAEVFLLLQAAAFGGKAIWIEGGRWANTSFRSYWTPTPTSSRRSPVNPMMPMPDTILRRLDNLMVGMNGVVGICGAVEGIEINDGTAYLDPPYEGTTKYGHSLDVAAFVPTIAADLYVSEGVALGGIDIAIASPRSKGGISGNRKVAANDEVVSFFPRREMAA